MKKLLFANWKMNLPEEGIEPFVQTVAAAGDEVELVVAPPFPFIGVLGEAARSVGSVGVGAQNCSDKDTGALTGEVSASMLRSVGVTYVIVGHSERRALFGEDSRMVGRKVTRILANRLRPVMCVGENQEIRESGRTAELLEQQLREAALEIEQWPAELVIAYEPVWAIGTGRNATPEIASDAHKVIRALLTELAPEASLRILYGGSVTPENAAELAADEEIDGFLVGGASLAGQKFLTIARSMQRREKKG